MHTAGADATIPLVRGGGKPQQSVQAQTILPRFERVCEEAVSRIPYRGPGG